MKAKGLSGLSPLVADGSRDSQAGKAGLHKHCSKDTQKFNPFRLDRFLVVRRARLDCMSTGQNTLQESVSPVIDPGYMSSFPVPK